jgi:predicted Zn-dependent protease
MTLHPSAWILSAALVIAGCATTPYTHRKQFIMVSPQEEGQMGLQAYQDVLKKEKVSTDPAATALVKRVGERIAQAANKPDYQWEFTLLDNPKTVNAFCLPGGKVAVYTGILPLTQDENGLAVVIGHEVSHAIARHGAERMTEQGLAGLIEQGAVVAGLIKSQAALQTVELAYGVGRGLPHSRAQEAEADHIGLILMAKAHYDPRTAVDFWSRMANASKGSAPPEFLSDHPSDAKRIQSIKEQIPEALSYYKQ